MGLAASGGRLLMIVARQSDIQFCVQSINQLRMLYAMQAASIGADIANYYKPDPGMSLDDMAKQADQLSAEYKVKLGAIQALDKPLEMQVTSLQAQEKMCQTEYEAVTKVIEKNIERSFKILA